MKTNTDQEKTPIEAQERVSVGSKELLGRDEEIANDIAGRIWSKHHYGMNHNGSDQISSRESLKHFIREAINRSRGECLTCECYAKAPNRCGKPATHDIIHTQPFNVNIASCEYHTEMMRGMGLTILKRPNVALSEPGANNEKP